MKHILVLFMLSGITVTHALAQVHLKGQRFLELQSGFTDNLYLNRNQLGMNAIISTGVYNRQYNAWKLSFSFTQKSLPLSDTNRIIPMRQYGVGWGHEFNLWRNATRTRFIRGVLQPTLLYEVVGSDQTSLNNTVNASTSASRFLLGGDVGLDVELSPVVISVRQRWQPRSRLQPFHTLFSIGWRFHR